MAMPGEKKRSQLGIRIHVMRGEKGVLQRDMARAMRVSQGTLSNWERGVHEPDTETLKRLADYFDVSLDTLLDRPHTNRTGGEASRPLADPDGEETRTLRSLFGEHEVFMTRLRTLDKPTLTGLITVVEAVLAMLPDA